METAKERQSVHYLSANEALRLFRSGELSPVDLLCAVIERAAAVESSVNAFAETFYEQALDAARMAEKRYRYGDARPLEGLPVAVKEEAPIVGQRSTQGSLPLRHEVADETAVVVQRIIEAGGIVHARTTTPEFCCAPVTYDALICPTFAVPALAAEWDYGDRLEGRSDADWMDVMMTMPFNIASRCPVMSVPSGLSREGVPTACRSSARPT